MLPSLEGCADNPTGFLFHGIDESQREILTNGDTLGDCARRDDIALGISRHDFALHRMVDEASAKSGAAEFQTDHVVLCEMALTEWS